ncbi:MAG: preprotein translocase subunit YajC [Clostridia bacterium]|nr:preprotein translocase subunit YajC [Clostridia bacterium]MBQ6859102.1 preprotein translocase subunit YajC [Clostridia bacterium]MBQ7052560.1 preprotein translocase subunit YajC [Clostridia bacterium]
MIVYYAIQFLPMILIFVIFYFMLIRPQRKKDKEAKKMLDNLKVGDRICTIGGIYGTIVRIKDQVLTIEVGDAKTQMMIARWAVRNVEQLSVTNDAETLI